MASWQSFQSSDERRITRLEWVFMNQEIYADGISAIHTTGNMIRIDLMTVQPHLKSENGQPVVEINKRIIMPLDGFVKSFALQEQIMKQLLEAGVVKQTTPLENSWFAMRDCMLQANQRLDGGKPPFF
jgi:hypothetical protein